MVRVQSTQQFLESKLANLEQKLRDDFNADEEQLQRIHSYICVVDGGIKQYAQSLGGMNLQDAASRLVEMLHIDADNQKDATQLVVQYMHMFMSVTDSLPA
jgi:hypothetical protein